MRNQNHADLLSQSRQLRGQFRILLAEAKLAIAMSGQIVSYSHDAVRRSIEMRRETGPDDQPVKSS
jgi:hypothetical protein